MTATTARPSAPVDTVDALLGADAASAVAALRSRRPTTVLNLQASHDALLAAGSPSMSLPERLAVAVFTAHLHGDEAAAAQYAARLADTEAGDTEADDARPDGARSTGAGLADIVRRAADVVAGPYGTFASAALSAFDQPGPEFVAPASLTAAVGERLAAALAYTHFLVLHPRDAAPARLRALERAGWSADGIVTLSQLVSFLACQLRVVAGLAVLAGTPRPLATPAATRSTAPAARRDDSVVDAAHRPAVFTSAQLEWEPWLPDVPAEDLTPVQRDALVDAGRAGSPYFRLLARDPGILKARTLADKDIFYNTRDGLPRAERELSAAAVSRTNGCVYCASVHSRFAAHYSKRPDDVQRLLDDGVAAAQEPRWRALIDAAAALTRTPAALGDAHVAALRTAGLDDADASDAVHAAAFFAWANRLMLALGEPRLP